MAGDLVPRCVPDPNNGPGNTVCPPGTLQTYKEAPIDPSMCTGRDCLELMGSSLGLVVFGLLMGLLFGWCLRITKWR